MTDAILTPSPPPHNIAAWLAAVLRAPAISPLGGDASARQYFRVQSEEKTYIAMQSPPTEKPAQFLAVQKILAAHQIPVPAVIHHTPDNKFILLEDFGDSTYFLAATKQNCHDLYTTAIRVLCTMQTLSPPANIPRYDEKLLRDEIMLYSEWYCRHYMQKPLTSTEEATFNRAADWLVQQCTSQPQVFVHRDYHSRNLMATTNGIGVLDFQDAVIGSYMYDLVSLLRDAYLLWDEQQQQQWLKQYYDFTAETTRTDEATMLRDFNIVGAQRGLKVLGIFARLWVRDGKESYLHDMPLVYRHLLDACCQTPELADLEILIRRLPPPCKS